MYGKEDSKTFDERVSKLIKNPKSGKEFDNDEVMDRNTREDFI
jgi:hypothetical protein